MNETNSALINFVSYKAMITDAEHQNDRITTIDSRIRRRKGFILTTQKEKKNLKCTITKRITLPVDNDNENNNLDTVPFGYMGNQ